MVLVEHLFRMTSRGDVVRRLSAFGSSAIGAVRLVFMISLFDLHEYSARRWSEFTKKVFGTR